MSGLTRDLLPNNILSNLRALERRVRALEMALASARNASLPDLLVTEKTTGKVFRLEAEYIDGVVTLWLAAAAAPRSGEAT